MIACFEEVLKERGIPFQNGVPTAGLCTFRIGGPCRRLIRPRCAGELIEAVRAARSFGEPCAVLGCGSNVLFCDGVENVSLISTRGLGGIVPVRPNVWRVGAGVSLPRLSHLVGKAGFADLTFACGIPGTVGGGIFMNAGAHGKCFGACVTSVLAYDPDCGEIKTYFQKELNISYRKSIFQYNNEIVLNVTLTWRDPQDPAVIAARAEALRAARFAAQPLLEPSAGSTFRRPSPEVPIGKIFDELGLKGLSHGGAVVSEKHAGFIVNRGGATADDVLALIEEIQNVTERERGFRPVTELCRIPGSV